jgi:hypothetical protein
MLGARARALELIKQALTRGYPVERVQGIPQLQQLRSDPSFGKLLAQSGKPQEKR